MLLLRQAATLPQVSAVLDELAIFYQTFPWKPFRSRRTWHCFARNSQVWVGLVLEVVNFQVVISRAESADNSAFPANDAKKRTPALESCTSREFWHWCTCDHVAYKVRLAILVGAVLHLACSVFELLQSGTTCFGGRGEVSGNGAATRPSIDQAGRWPAAQVATPPSSLAQLACPALSALLLLRSAIFWTLYSRVLHKCFNAMSARERKRKVKCHPPTRSLHTRFTGHVTVDALPVSVHLCTHTLG